MSETHPAVLAVHNAAHSVLQHGAPQAPASFWKRLVSATGPGLNELIRDFGHTLSNLLDVPPSLLTNEDIEAVGRDVNEVVERAEEAIDRNDPSGEPIEPLPPLIYTLRARYEQIYRRGGRRASST